MDNEAIERQVLIGEEEKEDLPYRVPDPIPTEDEEQQHEQHVKGGKMTGMEMYRKCQFELIPPNILNRIYERLCMHIQIVHQIAYHFLEWNQTTILTKKDPTFEMLQTLISFSSCGPICKDPDNHFREKMCTPIGILYDEVNKIVVGPLECLMSEKTRNEILERAKKQCSPEDRVTIDQDLGKKHLSVYDLPAKPESRFKFHTKSQIETSVLLLESIMGDADEDLIQNSLNVFENINRNFSLFIVPSVYSNDTFPSWQDFVDNQFSYNSGCILILATPNFLKHCEEFDESQQVVQIGPKILNEERDRVKYLITKCFENIKPVYMLIFNETEREKASNISPFVCLMPKDMPHLLLSIQRVLG